jgi:hypothetical protein
MGGPKRHIQPERYTTFFSPNLSSQAPSMAPEIFNFYKKYGKTIDKYLDEMIR